MGHVIAVSVIGSNHQWEVAWLSCNPAVGAAQRAVDILNQMVVGMALDVEGRPICSEMCPGNTADVKTLLPIVKRMRERFRLREITVVADRGMVSQATLEAFEKSDPPVRYIVVVPMRRQKEVNTSVAWQPRTPV